MRPFKFPVLNEAFKKFAGKQQKRPENHEHVDVILQLDNNELVRWRKRKTVRIRVTTAKVLEYLVLSERNT